METKKEIWIEKTLNSTDGLRSVPVSENLKSRLLNIPSEVRIMDTSIPMKAVWLAAASLALLLTVNIAAIRNVNKSNKEKVTSVYTNYFSYLDQL